MKLTCLNCKASLKVDFKGEKGVGECPKCGKKIKFPEATVEYKILTQKMLCGDRGFDKESGHAEGVLNALALEGWRVAFRQIATRREGRSLPVGVEGLYP